MKHVILMVLMAICQPTGKEWFIYLISTTPDTQLWNLLVKYVFETMLSLCRSNNRYPYINNSRDAHD